jgi:LacI family transcriptional regulator
MRRPRRVALFIESSISYGRGILRGIAKYLRSHGPWSIFVEQRELGAALPGWIASWNGDGIVTRSDDPRLRRLGIPLVALHDRRAPDGRVPALLNDNREIGRLAARHLLDRGFTRLAFVGPPGEFWSTERRAGAVEVAREVEIFETGRGSWEVEQRRLTAWLRRLPRPVGLVAANDVYGLRALDACRRAELAVPETVAVVGADDDAELCELSDPPLSSVRFNPERVGFEAAGLLDRLMKGGKGLKRPLRVAPLGVTARMSTDILAVDDEHIARALRYIRGHACEGMSVKDLLREVPLSRRSLEHRFRRLLGRTPKEEVRRLQVERAKSLLAGTDLKIARVSDEAGFHQPAYLSAVFRRSTGLTPAEYRRKARVR